MLEFLFNSEYCEIFKSTYFEEHLRTAASENMFMKLRKIKDCCGILTLHNKKDFLTSLSKPSENAYLFVLIS